MIENTVQPMNMADLEPTSSSEPIVHPMNTSDLEPTSYSTPIEVPDEPGELIKQIFQTPDAEKLMAAVSVDTKITEPTLLIKETAKVIQSSMSFNEMMGNSEANQDPVKSAFDLWSRTSPNNTSETKATKKDSTTDFVEFEAQGKKIEQSKGLVREELSAISFMRSNIGRASQEVQEEVGKYITEEGSVSDGVRKYQKTVNTVVDGNFGDNTVRAGKRDKNLEVVEFSQVKALTDVEEVKKIQTKLGFKGKGIDGQAGGGTANAIDLYNYKNSYGIVNIKNGRGALPVKDMAATLGISEDKIDRLVEIESGNKGYDVLNTYSGALGKYQFNRGTGDEIRAALGIKGVEWLEPKNQDKMFLELTRQNMQLLQGAEMDPKSIFNIYGTHQLGFSTFKKVVSTTDTLTETNKKNMNSNLPASKRLSAKATDAEYRKVWTDYWKNRTKI